jgi:glyoxylase-like metal-dependent hydrolase (beta-lactamase superfamily II)
MKESLAAATGERKAELAERASLLGSGLVRITAPNASAMTGRGTNTWIVGEGPVAVIDPGPDDKSHLAAILTALDGIPVAAILVTHAHLDHSALAPRLSAATGAPALAFGTATTGRSAAMSALAASGLTDGGEGLDHAFVPDRQLADGEVVEAGGARLEAVHTPGHLGGHLCFRWGEALFSGDHVMGWATSLVSPPDGDMTDYMASLERLARLPVTTLFPGHGDPVADAGGRIAELIRHRRDRENSVLAELARGAADAASLARAIYRDVPPAMLPAATRNVLAHLIDLHGRSLVVTDAPLTALSRFAPT